jgi:hypothetical protein
MRQLPQRPDLDQLRRQARELQRRSKPLTLSAAQLAVAREYGFLSWARLKEEVERRRTHPVLTGERRREQLQRPETRSWRGMRDWSTELLEKRTGRNVEAWNRLIGQQRFRDQAALRDWLTEMGVTGYGQMLLVWERFGYPEFMTASANDLVGRQYADRAHLRPILDATLAALAALPGIDPVAVVQARKTYVSLVSKRRTFAVVQATTKNRVDLGLRLRDQPVGGRLKSGKGVGNGSMTVSVSLTSPADLDDEALEWLKRAYDENA